MPKKKDEPAFKLIKPVKCTIGPSELFPDVEQCEGEVSDYLFGDPYCSDCFKRLVAIHHKLKQCDE